MNQQRSDVSVTALPEGAFLLDVREQAEWAAGHAEQALHVAMSTVPSRLAELPHERTIACVCRSGGRSSRVASFLSQQGFAAVNVAGGMTAWIAAGLPIVTDSGARPTVI